MARHLLAYFKPKQCLCFQSTFYVFNPICFQSCICVFNLSIHCFQPSNFVCNPNSLFPILCFYFQSHNHFSNLRFFFQSKLMFPIWEFCFRSILMFPQEKLSETFIQMSKNLKWKISLTCSRGIVSVFLEIFFWWLQNHRGLVVSFFFLDFSKSVPAQKILLSTRFFCLIMLHLLVNRKNHHSEVWHVTKKIIRWVFL